MFTLFLDALFTRVRLPPSMYMYSHISDALVDYMEQVAACAPDLPFYLYDINFMTGIYRK